MDSPVMNNELIDNYLGFYMGVSLGITILTNRF